MPEHAPRSENSSTATARSTRSSSAELNPEVAAAPRGLTKFVADLDPGYFALVMATGIVSIGASLFGERTLSTVMLVITCAVFAGLAAAYATRAVRFPSRLRADLRDPAVAMGFFTLVAGSNVLAVRLLIAGHPLVSVILGLVAVALWLVLSYGLPWSIMVAARRPVLGDINGTWLIWAVATQSVSVIASGLASKSPWPVLREELPAVAVAFWGVGIMLYGTLIVIIVLRLFLVEFSAKEMGPAYWIAMGATAISVRAAAGILEIKGPGSAQLIASMRPVLIGLSVVLWAFGTWWIPLLVLFGFWRYVLRRYPSAYEPRLWSVVFPLGMYTVASATLGTTPGLGFMVAVARVWLWVGTAAWVVTAVLFLASLPRRTPERNIAVGDGSCPE